MAFARGPAARQRFSLLLLEPGEIYFDDVSLVFYPDATDAGDQTDAHMKRHEAGRRERGGQRPAGERRKSG